MRLTAIFATSLVTLAAASALAQTAPMATPTPAPTATPTGTPTPLPTPMPTATPSPMRSPAPMATPTSPADIDAVPPSTAVPAAPGTTAPAPGTTAPAPGPTAAAPVPIQPSVGATVYGAGGTPVGTIKALTAQTVTLTTAKGEVQLPAAGVGPGLKGPVIGLTAAQLDAAVTQAQGARPATPGAARTPPRN